MRLNTIKPNPKAKRASKRLGRGIGSGSGKTCGRGHKGQHSRAGGYHRIGFEGGQMPLQRRIPKFGFTSRKADRSAEIRLHELDKVKDADTVITLDILKKYNIIGSDIKFCKLILSGKLSRKGLTIKGIKVTRGALDAIQKLGGKVEA